MPESVKTLLSIAGSDPLGGAGIQADIRSGILMGFHVATAVTAVTAQNSHGLSDLGVIPSYLLKDQLASILQDVTPDAVKIGMIGSLENMRVVIDFLHSVYSRIPVVIDPVLKSSAGNRELSKDEIPEMIDLYRNELFPLTTVLTPNIEEYGQLFPNAVLSEEESDRFDTRELNCNSVIITGATRNQDSVSDILVYKGDVTSITHKRVDCHNLHGTGCVFSSVLACFLGEGNNVPVAFSLTSAKMNEIILRSCDHSLGVSTYGPLNINNYNL